MRAYGWGDPRWRNPITGIPGCCGLRAASGQADRCAANEHDEFATFHKGLADSGFR